MVKTNILFFLFTLIFNFNGFLLSLDNLTVIDPPTAYIQWLTTATDSMTEADGNNTMALDPYQGGATTLMSQSPSKDLYIGIMCNRLTGYDLTLTATNPGATPTTAKLTIAGSTDLILSATLNTVTGTFAAGATTGTNLNLTGASASGSAVFATNGDLPLNSAAPNVWKISVTPPSITNVSDGLIMNGSYQGGITATVTLK